TRWSRVQFPSVPFFFKPKKNRYIFTCNCAASLVLLLYCAIPPPPLYKASSKTGKKTTEQDMGNVFTSGKQLSGIENGKKKDTDLKQSILGHDKCWCSDAPFHN